MFLRQNVINCTHFKLAQTFLLTKWPPYFSAVTASPLDILINGLNDLRILITETVFYNKWLKQNSTSCT